MSTPGWRHGFEAKWKWKFTDTILFMSFQVRQSIKLFDASEPEPTSLLSLQQTSKLYVISNLEEFPPDVLTQLPLRFRRDFLLMLPPADTFQLEQTSVVDGIDMENEIWKKVYERYDYEVANEAHIAPDQCFIPDVYAVEKYNIEGKECCHSQKHLSQGRKPSHGRPVYCHASSCFCFIYNHLKSALCP